MREQRWTLLALSAFVGLLLTGCGTAFGASYQTGPHLEVIRPAGGPHYSDTPEYRRIRRDADRYADLLDRELRLGSRQERDIERLLIDRARDLLRHTPPRYHRSVYPFPRSQRTSTVRQWWNRTDDLIMRYLDYYQRDRYRALTYSMDRGPYYEYDYDYRDRYDYDGDRRRGRR